MSIHAEPHPLAGQNVIVQKKHRSDQIADIPVPATLEDYWDRVIGESWMFCEGNPAALHYALRAGSTDLPFDDDVVYVKINGLGHLVHTSELVSA